MAKVLPDRSADLASRRPLSPREATELALRYHLALEALRGEYGAEAHAHLLMQVITLSLQLDLKSGRRIISRGVVEEILRGMQETIARGRNENSWRIDSSTADLCAAVLTEHDRQLNSMPRGELLEEIERLPKSGVALPVIHAHPDKPAMRPVNKPARAIAQPSKKPSGGILTPQSVPALIKARSAKITVILDQESFPLDQIPPAGTPGAKTAQLPFTIQMPGGRAMNVTLKGATLQRFVQMVRENPDGGAAVVTGRLSDDGRSILEAGIVFQPKVVSAPAEANSVAAAAE